MAFKAIVQGIANEDAKYLALPLTTVFSVHHNLVTEGVDLQYLRPDKKAKNYYSPSEACSLLKKGALFCQDPNSANCKAVVNTPCVPPAGTVLPEPK